MKIKIHQTLAKFIEINPSLAKFIEINPSLAKFIKINPSLAKFMEINQIKMVKYNNQILSESVRSSIEKVHSFVDIFYSNYRV